MGEKCQQKAISFLPFFDSSSYSLGKNAKCVLAFRIRIKKVHVIVFSLHPSGVGPGLRPPPQIRTVAFLHIRCDLWNNVSNMSNAQFNKTVENDMLRFAAFGRHNQCQISAQASVNQNTVLTILIIHSFFLSQLFNRIYLFLD